MLNRIETANSLRHMEFRSLFGNIVVHALDQSSTFFDSTHIILTSQGNVSFSTGPSEFYSIFVDASGAINQNVNISTYNGSMEFNFDNYDFVIGSDVHLYSTKQIDISGTGNYVQMESPNQFESLTNMTILSPILITNSQALTLRSHSNIYVGANLTSNGINMFACRKGKI